MKVGILTFHNAYNYGAILQTYATQELVRDYGYDVEVINYHNKTIDRAYAIKFPRRYFYKIPLALIRKFYFCKRKKAYAKFVNNYLCINKVIIKSVEKASLEKYNIILIGSDQLWNNKITGGWDRMYWGDFLASPETRKVAWSICMNNDDFTCEDKNFIVRNLKNFSNISVREKSLQLFLKDLTKIEYPQTLDPTLLLSKQQWEVLCNPVKERNYIAVYAVQDEDATVVFARHIAEKTQKNLVVIRSYSMHYWSKENKEFCGPDEFLSYIRYADFVVTTSFHGTVFSLIFQKQFVCPEFRNNTRIDSLLETVGLCERRVQMPDDVYALPDIDFNKVEELLEQERFVSRNFLNMVLNENTNS